MAQTYRARAAIEEPPYKVVAQGAFEDLQAAMKDLPDRILGFIRANSFTIATVRAEAHDRGAWCGEVRIYPIG